MINNNQRAAFEQQKAHDYESVIADHRRLVRELDVLLNGEEGAAKQASLCDIVAQVRRDRQRREAPGDGGRESVEDALSVVESFGPGIEGVNDTFARQIILADEVKRLRKLYEQAVAGRAKFREAYRQQRRDPVINLPPLTEAEILQEWSTYRLSKKIGEPSVAEFVFKVLQRLASPAREESLQAENDRAVGRAWRENSSLEEWFPLTFEELNKLKVEVAKLRSERKSILDRKFLVAVKDLCNNYGGPTPDDCTGDYAWVGDVWRTASRILKSADQP